ncbi:MAG: DUF4340 domain-containing protein, partial [Deltaproteobacteria bacterium]|nr:DUF4340 domain-containing protein [Deltaproteobacteria bacterium]
IDGAQKLFPFDVDEVQALSLEYPDKKLLLTKDLSGEWILNENPPAAADTPTIRAVLSALSVSRINQVVEENADADDLKTFGLDQPLVTVQIGLEDGRSLPAILVGDNTPIGFSAYVKRKEESSVLLTDAAVRESLKRSPENYRDRRIFHIEPGKVAKLEIQKGNQSFALVRGKDGDWNLAAPEQGTAKMQAVSEYLSNLVSLRANKFADHKPTNLKKYQLDKPILSISLENSAAEKLGTLLIGKNAQVFAKRVGNPTVYTIDARSYDRINKSVDDFMDRG